jgi:leucyl-tRNA synthetase
MSKHLGNVVDPDELVARYGADTVRLAVLYAARPQKSLNWSDSAVLHCNRFLKQVWETTQRAIALARAQELGNSAGVAVGAASSENGSGETGSIEPERDTTEHLRLKLSGWCDAAVQRTTTDMESLEMHSAVRNARCAT